MSEKDEMIMRIAQEVAKLYDTTSSEGKLLVRKNKEAFVGKLAVACNAFGHLSRAVMQDKFVEVLRRYRALRKRKGYECVQDMIESAFEYNLAAFAKAIEEPFKRYFPETTHNQPGFNHGYHIRKKEIDAFAGAVTDVIFTADSQFWCKGNIEFFLFNKLQQFLRSALSDDDLARKLADAVWKEHDLKDMP